MSALSVEMEAVRTYELSRRPVYEAGLAQVGKIARSRGWVYRNGIGWLCPGCEGLG